MAEEFEKSEILWAKMARFPWWPAYVLSSPSSERREVVFFGDNTRAVVSTSNLRSWADGLGFAVSGSHRRKLQEAVADAEKAIGCDSRLSSEQVTLLTSQNKVLSTGDNSVSLERPTGVVELEDSLRDALRAPDRRKLDALRTPLGRAEAAGPLLESRLGAILRETRQALYKAPDPQALGLLNEATSMVVGGLLRQLGGGLGPCCLCVEEVERRRPTLSDPRTGFRVAKKISKTLHAKLRERPLGAETCRAFGEKLERKLREASSSEDEYRKSVLKLIDQPEDALRVELEKSELESIQLPENGKIKTIFRNCS